MRQVLGEGAVAVDADAAGVGAEVPPAGQAVAAAAADQVALAADQVALVVVVDVVADVLDHADELVADDHAARGIVLRAQSSQFQMWTSVPQMLVLRMRISTSLMPDLGHRDVLEPEPFFGLCLDQCFHR